MVYNEFVQADGYAVGTPYELYYFPVRGRGQAIRYFLVDNGLEYKEISLTWDTWSADYKQKATLSNVHTTDSYQQHCGKRRLKSLIPFGQCPLLKKGDLWMAQSSAILRYLGRKHGLSTDDPEECLKVDMVNDHLEDVRKTYTALAYDANFDTEKVKYKEALPSKLLYLENLFAKWGNTFILNKITFADYNCFELLEILQVLSPDCLKECPTLKKYWENIAERSALKTYRSTDSFKEMKINGSGNQ